MCFWCSSDLRMIFCRPPAFELQPDEDQGYVLHNMDLRCRFRWIDQRSRGGR